MCYIYNMKNVINNKFILAILLLLIYLFLIDGSVMAYLILLYFNEAFECEISGKITLTCRLVDLYVIFVFFSKFYLLPLVYLILCKYVTNPSIRQFLHNIRYKWLYKISLLFLSLIVTIIWGTLLLEKLSDGPHTLEYIIGSGQLVCLVTPFVGGYQALLILYLYWFIYDVVFEKIGFLKKFKQYIKTNLPIWYQKFNQSISKKY